MAKEKFEEAMAKLEALVRKMETGDMTLEESLKAFEEGIRLSRLCASRLDDAERRVEMLIAENSNVTVQPLRENGEKNES
ncbi:exodeoxyribonuclease VII small subunit [Syntrophus aciditrophicus]|jgi:exodeoxyribonuclease VII small subunit|uniref:Exodeoxyribonuclease 7 small subunit n=1 Tax=Syntrophus aciditrophicus (strain SB) TaxID=56780 RepID=EX7S_SYNAS|nr:exodeoxyribonuclease VII small subunit [Syntrophus aciditrophicus]Q2LUA0.1 RecName: Full=Exodeoxyribonuclease 7 small subunit; AltName: Full=Exodeoxyribonuclease VII small subunit; Short=Exonuclease VII small subunit [Syntrophus aciditrophicus SB]ABC77663.1 exodeoxyribonuclease VII small subunit [Syntrophus aciditrophicus SB]OPY14565.1 MAG: Exodeoxyribonuclease 7 small subunit [Syntrophus sp. PtaB.Bin075]